ncbi:MAG: sulfatase [Acidobacteriota bacterium]
MNRKVLSVLGLLTLSTLLLFFFNACSKKNDDVDHIFLVTVDTLRADHLSSYGYFRNTTPFIDSLGSKGIIFEKAISQSATTCSSIASIFTGMYPSEHKVLANGFILDDLFLTMPEILKERSYRTAAFTSTDRHFLASNIDQGFDTYSEPANTKKSHSLPYMPCEYVIKKAVKWLKTVKKNDKFFIWIHLFDPHLPFDVSKAEMRTYFPRHEREKFRKKLKSHLNITKNDLYRGFFRMDKIFTKYDSEIRSVDDQIKLLFQFAERSGLNKRSLWVISADHGEGLGQHKWREHAMELYQESLHVPLIFYSPNKNWGFRYPGLVENSSIFPTIIELTGNLKKRYGNFRISARSLKQILDNSSTSVSDPSAFSERQILGSNKSSESIKPGLKKFYAEGEKYSFQNDQYKYIFRTKGVDEFFDLEKDPYELNNLLLTGKNNADSEKLKAMMLRIISRIKKKSGIPGKHVRKDIIKKLKSLGYVL